MANLHAIKPEMVVVPAGSFLMGSNREKDPAAGSTEPEPLTLILPEFLIGKYQVTVREYRPFIDSGGYQLGENIWGHYGRVWREKNQITQPYKWNEPKWTGDDRLPVVGVCWYEAMAYCRWLSREIRGAYGLPTEAEWEKAARGTDGRIYPWGDTFDASLCNCWPQEVPRTWPPRWGTKPVGSYPKGASPYGAMDMIGNVWEWCLSMNQDLNRYPDYADPRKHPDHHQRDHPRDRILRGGSWEDFWGVGQPGFSLRTTARHYLPPDSQSCNVGFRLAVSGLQLKESWVVPTQPNL